jgi:hypothetical protein
VAPGSGSCISCPDLSNFASRSCCCGNRRVICASCESSFEVVAEVAAALDAGVAPASGIVPSNVVPFAEAYCGVTPLAV